MNPYRKETAHLWLAMALLLFLVSYRVWEAILACLAPGQYGFALSLPDRLAHTVSIVVLFLLWAAYARWTGTIQRRRELEFVLRGIGPDMIIVIDPQRRINMCTEAVESVFGYTPHEVIGKTTDFLYFDRRITGNRHEIYDQLQQIGFHTGFAKGRRKDGRIIPLEVITGELPRQPGAVILIRDITERKMAEDQLIKAKEGAERAHAELKEVEEMRDSLINMLVHDLKSPLTAISGYLELLLRYSSGKLDEKESGFLTEASRLTMRMAEMIGSILDVRRLESHDMPIHMEICDLKQLLMEAMELIGPEAVAREVTVDLPMDSTLAFCDRNLVRRIMANLIGNAIKFTPASGKVTVRFESEGNKVRTLVQDTGPGIPEEYHAKIFELFGQVEIRRFSTGIGLAFCKLAVNAQGGAIQLESKVGEGSTFSFTLPATPNGTTHQGR